MLQDEVEIDTEEHWADIPDFPGYTVSTYGRIRNEQRGSYLTISINTKGLAMVGLMRDARQTKRSVPLLVASVHLEPHPSREFDTPINLDGNKLNNHVDNLAWRPLWFARRYTRQFFDDHPTFPHPIEDVATGEVYESSMSASIKHGVLDIEIYTAMRNNHYVWPTNQTFRQVVA